MHKMTEMKRRGVGRGERGGGCGFKYQLAVDMRVIPSQFTEIATDT